MIDVRNISKTFRKFGKALNQVTLQVEAGERVGLIGPSESGKSTLMHHLSGLVPIRGFDYSATAAMLLIVIVVSFLDLVSAVIRKHFI